MILNIKFYARNRKYFIKRWSNNIARKIYFVKSFLGCKYMEFKYFIQGCDLQAEIDADIERELAYLEGQGATSITNIY